MLAPEKFHSNRGKTEGDGVTPTGTREGGKKGEKERQKYSIIAVSYHLSIGHGSFKAT